MKTITRQLSTALFCAVLITAPSLFGADTSSVGGLTITTYAGITSYTLSQSVLNSIVNAMLSGNPSQANWIYVQNSNCVNLAQVLSYNNIGNDMRYGLKITSLSSTFTLAQIRWSETGGLGSSSGTFGGQSITYSGHGIGINYGPDGIAGTSDDIIYTSGNAYAPVNAIYLIGMSESFNTGGLSVGDALNSWSNSCPITETVTYSLNGVSASTTVTYVVPTSLWLSNLDAANVVVSWPTSSQTLLLQENQNIGSTNWITVTNAPTIVGNVNKVTLPKTGKSMFFRLKYP